MMFNLTFGENFITVIENMNNFVFSLLDEFKPGLHGSQNIPFYK